jgi:hypothetical protein
MMPVIHGRKAAITVRSPNAAITPPMILTALDTGVVSAAVAGAP